MGFEMLDPMYWILIGPTILFALLAQWWVKSAYAQYSRIGNSRGLTGSEAAARILEREGIRDVRIEVSEGWLSDHYDPREKVLRLSPEVFHGRSVAAVGIAAHEVGHAIQHAQTYPFLAVRNAFVPLASLGSWMAFPLIGLGFALQSLGMIKLGIILFACIVAFQFLTLPVEFNASSRAKDTLQRYYLLTHPEEIEGVNRVLNAAAMTYVAATVSALAQLLYYLLLLSGSSRERD